MPYVYYPVDVTLVAMHYLVAMTLVDNKLMTTLNYFMAMRLAATCYLMDKRLMALQYYIMDTRLAATHYLVDMRLVSTSYYFMHMKVLAVRCYLMHMRLDPMCCYLVDIRFMADLCCVVTVHFLMALLFFLLKFQYLLLLLSVFRSRTYLQHSFISLLCILLSLASFCSVFPHSYQLSSSALHTDHIIISFYALSKVCCSLLHSFQHPLNPFCTSVTF